MRKHFCIDWPLGRAAKIECANISYMKKSYAKKNSRSTVLRILLVKKRMTVDWQ